jgi:hypothetical protein
MSQSMVRASELSTFAVEDSAGTQIGMVEDLVIDLRGGNVSNNAGGAGTGTAVPAATDTGGIGTAVPAGTDTGGTETTTSGQANGTIAYVVITRSGTAGGAADLTGTAVPAGTAGPSGTGTAVPSGTETAAGGELVPIPWHLVTIDPVNQTLTVDMTASELDLAPSFPSGEWPDLFGSTWSSELNSFWGSQGTGGTSGTAEPMTTATP